MEAAQIVIAGATGNLGGRIAQSLSDRGARVRAIVRRGAATERLRAMGVTIVEADYRNAGELARACEGAACVVSALAGLHEVVVEAQTALLQAAVKAGVPRFIPSDYSIDFTALTPGKNRNLDLRRDFHQRLAGLPIAATTIFNGAFTDMLTGQAPIILFKLGRVLYWGDAGQRLDFTSIDDTATFTAAAALDPSTPRYLRIAGDQTSARELAKTLYEVKGARFRLFRGGGLGRLEKLITFAKAVAPGGGQVYPPWQGMQYLRDMFGGRATLDPLDNDRYPGMRWTRVRDVLAGEPN